MVRNEVLYRTEHGNKIITLQVGMIGLAFNMFCSFLFCSFLSNLRTYFNNIHRNRSLH